MNKLKGTIFTVAVISLAAFSVFFHPITTYAEEKADYLAEYEAKVYDNYDGLVSAEINAIAQTDNGYIWVGTYSGLYRYDGYQFERLDVDSSISNVMVLYSDSKGMLWIGTNDSGLACYDPEKNEIFFYTPDDGLGAFSIRSITEDEEGNIYVGTVSYLSVITTDGKVKSFTDMEDINGVRSLACLGGKLIGGITNSGKLFVLDDGKLTDTLTTEEEGVYFTSISHGSGSKFIVGTSERYVEKIHYADDTLTSEKTITTEKSNYYNDILYDDETGGYLFCSENGMGLLNADTDEITYLMQNNFDASVSGVIKDYQNNIWFVSNKQGIIEYSKNPFMDIFVKAGLTPDVVNSTAIRGNELFIGCDDGLIVLDMNTYTRIENEVYDEIRDVRIRHILVDSKDNLWISTYGRNGLVEIKSDGTMTSFNEGNGTIGGRFRYCLELSDGTILAASNMGLNYIKDGAVTATLDEDSGMSAPQILTMTLCKDGSVLAGSDGDGIYRIKDKKITENIGINNGLDTLVVLRIVEFDKGYIYVTSNALYYDDGKHNIKRLTQFPYTNCYDVFISGEEAWISSSAGIFVVRTDELIENKEYHYTLLDYTRGFTTSLTANAWNSVVDDNLLLCCTDGIRRISTKNYDLFDDDYFIRINNLTYNDEPITPSSKGVYNIPAGSGRIQILPAILNYTLSNPLVHIFLEGSGDDGITTYHQNMEGLDYTNLPYGKYKLHVEILDPITGGVDRDEVFSIYKKPYFTELLIFKLAVLLLGAGVVAFIVWRIISDTIIRRQYVQIKEARDEAERANSAKSRFLANMSHEIRTPINTIMGMNQMIQREKSSAGLSQYRNTVMGYSRSIGRASESLLTLVNDILDLSKIESGKMNLVEQNYDTLDLLRSIITMIRVRSSEKGLDFFTDIDSNLPSVLYGDDGKIKQVLLNLLTNANKYTEKGSFTLHIKIESIADDTAKICFSVEDTGIGIKEEDMDKLFSAFERLDEQRNSAILGTGLGLDISRQFVELMGDELKVKSTYGEGSTFSFTIDQRIVDQEPIGEFNDNWTEEIGEEEYVPLFVSPEAKVLVVDDNEVNLQVIGGLLSGVMIVPETCTSGEKALEKIAENDYDIVLLDHMMPGLDGVETVHRIRETHPDLTVVALTANAATSGEDYYIGEGFNGYLSKPIEGRLLEEKLAEFLPDGILHDPSEIPDDIAANAPAADSGLSSEDDELLTSLNQVDGISVSDGIRFCGTKKAFAGALRTFLETLDEKSAEIEQAYADEDYRLYGIKVHALKSASRMIGMADLSALALSMEDAANADDTDSIHAHTAELLEMYRYFGTAISLPKDEADDNRPEADAATIQDAYMAIAEVCTMMDYDSVEMILESMNEYSLPPEDAGRFERIELALKKLDWDTIRTEVTQ